MRINDNHDLEYSYGIKSLLMILYELLWKLMSLGTESQSLSLIPQE